MPAFPFQNPGGQISSRFHICNEAPFCFSHKLVHAPQPDLDDSLLASIPSPEALTPLPRAGWVRLILAGTVGLGLLFWMVEVLEEGEAEVVETLLDP